MNKVRIIFRNPKFLVIVCLIICISVIGFTVACSQRASEIKQDINPTLEFENVLRYKLDLNPNTKVPETISGVCGRSAYCVSGVTTKTNGNSLIVFVKISLFKGQTGNFSADLKINNTINFLKFGTKEYLLWQR